MIEAVVLKPEDDPALGGVLMPEDVVDMTTETHISVVTYLITVFGLLWCVWIKMNAGGLRSVARSCGVAIVKVGRAAREIERKTFHLCGLLVPAIYQLLLSHGWSRWSCRGICWAVTAAGWVFDIARINVPAVNAWFATTPVGLVMREKERTQLSGACFFSLGCTLSVHFFPPNVAICSIMFLVLGDMAAALIGVSFGGEACVVKLGREGKKSAEGSVAMFLTCFLVAYTLFGQVCLAEYAAFVAALVATLTELYEPFGLNDNLTIPIFSAAAMAWAFGRIQECSVLAAGGP